MLHGRLTTKVRLAQWGIGDNQDYVLCSSNRETEEHLLFACTYSIELWNLYLQHIGINRLGQQVTEVETAARISRKVGETTELYNMMFVECVYHI